jgi:hypothetical protein
VTLVEDDELALLFFRQPPGESWKLLPRIRLFQAATVTLLLSSST